MSVNILNSNFFTAFFSHAYHCKCTEVNGCSCSVWGLPSKVTTSTRMSCWVHAVNRMKCCACKNCAVKKLKKLINNWLLHRLTNSYENVMTSIRHSSSQCTKVDVKLP